MTESSECQHESCDNPAKEKYDHRFCGVHRAEYYETQMDALEAALAELSIKYRQLQAVIRQLREAEEGETQSAIVSVVVRHLAALFVGGALTYWMMK